jgi:2-aminoadipate transaminase
MRLNFAGVPDADIREGVRRIGRVVHEQLSLISTLSGAPPRAPAAAPPPPPRGEAGLADVVALPRRDAQGAARRRRDR